MLTEASIQQLLEILFAGSMVFDLVVILLVLRLGKKQKLIHLYCVTFALIVVWKVFMFAAFYCNTSQAASLIIDEFSFALGSLEAFLLFFFAWHLIEKEFVSQKVVTVFAFIAVVFALLSFVPDLIVGPRVNFTDSPYNALILPRSLTFLFYISVIPPLLATVYMLTKAYKNFTGIRKLRVLFVGFSVCVAFTITVVTNVLVPIVYKYIFGASQFSSNVWFSNQQIVGVIVLSVINASVAYAVTRYRFMDIAVVVKKSLVYSAAMAVSSTVFALLLLALYRQRVSFLLFFIVVLIAVIFSGKYQQWCKRALDSIFFLDELDLSKKLSADTQQMNGAKELNAFVAAFIKSIHDVVPAQVLTMFVPEREHNRFIAYYPANQKAVLSFADPVVAALAQHEDILIAEELEFAKDLRTKEVLHYMGKHSAAVLCVVRQETKIFGILLLGAKPDKKLFFHNEISQLQNILQSSSGPLAQAIMWRESIEAAKIRLHNESY